jgi:hypothetical protein
VYVYSRDKRGLGDTSTDLLASISSSDTLTGLPVLWEIGLGLLGTAVLLSYAGKGRKSYRRYSRQRKARSVRKAQLRAELAAL